MIESITELLPTVLLNGLHGSRPYRFTSSVSKSSSSHLVKKQKVRCFHRRYVNRRSLQHFLLDYDAGSFYVLRLIRFC